MKTIIKNSLITSSMIFMLSGCRSQIKELNKEDYQEPKVKNTKLFNEDLKSKYNKANKTKNNKTFVQYNIDLERNDLLELKDKKINVNINDMTFDEVMDELSIITNSGKFYGYKSNKNNVVSTTRDIVNNVARNNGVSPIINNSNEDRFSFNVDTNIYNIIISLERYRNVDISYKNNSFYIFDKISIQGNLNAENKDTKTLENLQKHLTSLLGSESKVLVEGLTGTFSVTHTPNEMRDNIEIIENIINVSNSSRLFKMYVYKVNNNLLKENGLSRSMFIGDVMTLASGGSISQTPIFDRLFKKNDIGSLFGKDVGIDLGLQLREQEEIIHSVSTLKLNVFNGVESKMKSTKEGGNWIPGELSSQNSVVNGVSQTTYTETKPTFETDDVGLQLNITPSINNSSKSMVLSIDYNESSLFGVETQVWNRSRDSSITLKKNLKSQNSIVTKLSLNGNEYKVISGLKEETFNGGSNYNPLLNYLGSQNKSVEKKDMLVIAKSDFPSKTIVKTLTKKNMIKFKNDYRTFKPKTKRIKKNKSKSNLSKIKTLKPKTKIVEKIVYRDKIIEKPIEKIKLVEKIVNKEIIKEVPKTVVEVQIKEKKVYSEDGIGMLNKYYDRDILKIQKEIRELELKTKELSR